MPSSPDEQDELDEQRGSAELSGSVEPTDSVEPTGSGELSEQESQSQQSGQRKHRGLLLVMLHVLLLFYSFTGVLSKYAAGEEFLSLPFILFYAGDLLILFLYALAWQQIIKRMPLTAAYANRAVTVIWGMIWGVLFFQEVVTWPKVVGAVIIMIGIVLFAQADNEQPKTPAPPQAEDSPTDGSAS